jgi:hypothetical protein
MPYVNQFSFGFYLPWQASLRLPPGAGATICRVRCRRIFIRSASGSSATWRRAAITLLRRAVTNPILRAGAVLGTSLYTSRACARFAAAHITFGNDQCDAGRRRHGITMQIQYETPQQGVEPRC